jgi:hypothetical protein
MQAISASSCNSLLAASLSLLAVMCCAPSVAQDAAHVEAASAALTMQRPLIVEPVSEAHLTVLKGNTHPLARREFDLGSAPATLPMQRMLLVLKRSPQQQSALKKLLDDQQDKHSPNYHKWLTPELFGRKFGPSDGDIQAISAWLQSHGFQVSATKGRTVIEFSGSASQVKETFHTAIHKYVVNGEQHWANASDPQIPAALAPAVSGVLTLHNFIKRPQSHLIKEPAVAQIIPGNKPQVTFPAQNGQPITHALGPHDYATIYNITPSYNSVQGAGVTIGVVGRSNLYGNNGLGFPGEDVTSFQSVFFLPTNFPHIILNGPDPGDLGGGEEGEATLDTTWSGAIAYLANVDLVVSATTNTTDGIDLSEVFIVENNLADIMTESFSGCELFATDAQLAFTYRLAEQAAAQGITSIVSTGDNGAEGCDDPSVAPATNPVSVNLLASTPFNVAVGGTMFNENGQDSKYWGTEPPVAESAISYIPENVWNESGPTAGLWSSSGGASAGNIQAGGTTPGVPKPSWQSGVAGIPADGVRDLPDVSLTAAGHDPYLVCLKGSCFPDSQGRFFIYFASGTSASAPAFAGIMALVDQQMFNLGQSRRQGQPNYVLYRLAASQDLLQCNGSNTTTPPDPKCTFNDTMNGNNAVPGELNYGAINAKYQAGVGYDLATGLGSVNVANLVANWNSVSFNPTTTTLDLNPKSNITHGSAVSVNVSVVPTTGTGTPTGDVSLIAATPFPVQTSMGGYSLNNGVVASSTSQLPGGGSYNVTAHYAGDATYAASDSNPIFMTVSPEPSTIAVSGPLTQDANGFYTVPFSNGPYGSPVFIRADVQGTSGHGVPTGSVVFTDSAGPIPNGMSSPLLNSEGNTSIRTIFFDAGTHTISAAYGSDSSFNSSMSTQNPNPALQSVTFSIQPGFFVASSPNSVTIATPGGSGTTMIGILASSGFSAITFTCSGLPAEATCSPASVTGSGPTTMATATITVTTTGPHLTRRFERGPYYLAHWLTGGGFIFAGVFLVGSPRRRRSAMPLLLIVLAILMMIPACGGGGGGSSVHHQQDPGTPLGTYPITISATGAGVTQLSQFQLLVN